MTGDQAIYLMEKFKRESMNDNKGSQQMKAGETMEKQKVGKTMEYKPQYGKIKNGTLVRPPYSSNSREELEKDGYKEIWRIPLRPSDKVKYVKIYRDEVDHISENYLILEPTNSVNEFYVKEQDKCQ